MTRRALHEELDRPHLKELPSEPYAFAEWRLRRVGIDYHVEVEAHFYSVPYRFARREVEVRLTPGTVEVFLKDERIVRICAPAAITTTPPSPITCPPAIGATPTGPSSASATRPPRSAPPRRL